MRTGVRVCVFVHLLITTHSDTVQTLAKAKVRLKSKSGLLNTKTSEKVWLSCHSRAFILCFPLLLCIWLFLFCCRSVMNEEIVYEFLLLLRIWSWFVFCIYWMAWRQIKDIVKNVPFLLSFLVHFTYQHLEFVFFLHFFWISDKIVPFDYTVCTYF